jgi:RHS repeat-associated protein
VDATGTGTNVSGVTHTAPSVNTDGANRLGITITAPTAITTMTPPSGSTERADQAGGATVPTVSVETSDFAIAVAGASGTKQTVSAVAATSLTATIALRPVSTTGGSGANTTTSITKFYRSGGATVALRRDGTITWLLGDIQGGIAVSVPNGPGLTGVQRQRYLPYGQRRGSNLAASGTNSNDNITTTDHGFLGQVEDNTGLDYLNNRYHDPTLGRFTSVDPIVAVTHDAYGYGNNNPMTFSDPSGLEPCGLTGHCTSWDFDGPGGSGDGKDGSSAPTKPWTLPPPPWLQPFMTPVPNRPPQQSYDSWTGCARSGGWCGAPPAGEKVFATAKGAADYTQMVVSALDSLGGGVEFAVDDAMQTVATYQRGNTWVVAHKRLSYRAGLSGLKKILPARQADYVARRAGTVFMVLDFSMNFVDWQSTAGTGQTTEWRIINAGAHAGAKTAGSAVGAWAGGTAAGALCSTGVGCFVVVIAGGSLGAMFGGELGDGAFTWATS